MHATQQVRSIDIFSLNVRRDATKSNVDILNGVKRVLLHGARATRARTHLLEIGIATKKNIYTRPI